MDCGREGGIILNYGQYWVRNLDESKNLALAYISERTV
jgi:hypothetical protein